MKVKSFEKGFTLTELAIAVVGFSIIGLTLAVFAVSRSNSVENVLSVGKSASDSAESGLKRLAGVSYSLLTPTTSFAKVLADDGTIDYGTIVPADCTESNCDFVLEPPDAMGTPTSIAGGIRWQSGYSPPVNVLVAYLRRWSIEEYDTDLKLRKITMVVLSSEQSDKPLVVVETIVGGN